MVETGGLENHCTGNGTGGSNPSPSATQSGLQRNSAAFPPELREIAAILRFPPRNRTGESIPLSATGRLWSVFLWRAHAQSSFHDSIRRTQCDQQPMIRRKQLDFVSTVSDTKVLICLVTSRTARFCLATIVCPPKHFRFDNVPDAGYFVRQLVRTVFPFQHSDLRERCFFWVA